MVIKCTIERDRRLVILVYAAVVSDEEVLSTYEKLGRDPRIQAGYTYLVDFSDEDSTARSSGTVARLAKLAKDWGGGAAHAPGKVAVIAPDDLSYGLTRMYQERAGRSSEEYQVFRNASEAVAWLGIPISILDQARSRTTSDLD